MAGSIPPTQKRLPVLVDASRSGKCVVAGMVVVHRPEPICLRLLTHWARRGSVEACPDAGNKYASNAPVTAGELSVGIASRWVRTAPWRSTVTVVEDGNNRSFTSSILELCQDQAEDRRLCQPFLPALLSAISVLILSDHNRQTREQHWSRARGSASLRLDHLGGQPIQERNESSTGCQRGRT